MKLTGHYLSEKQLMELSKVSKETDISVSELIRRAIDDWLDKRNK